MMLIFIPWDIIFTRNGVWGFNKDYLLGLDFLDLPIEEWLFFICIPYACLFTHYSLKKLLFKNGLSNMLVKYISYSLIVFGLIISIKNSDRDYTFYNMLLSSIVVVLTYLVKPQTLSTFFISFVIILIPFFIVNGILTGSLLDDPVVWYNNSENLGIRLITIPVEDVFYALSMLLIPQLLIDFFRDRSISL